ncbi:hypothetical protein GCM10007972_00210 [Iodidimonas muriae]|uniref:DUF2065 domain-containing protein n=1 Tax=Iodidimonas muriae TaxID=261467 RepID=A0ABQ2L5I1_9PROT|nr:DUF2065 domain-containing protein [Iodidimonas muriae]GGO04113.1 hypothetical protein GCM10007972_00210 [Iodidimonas muriae]
MMFDWGDFGVAVGLALVFEGLGYALAPDFMRRLYAMMLLEPVQRLRLMGAVAVCLGFVAIWAIRG